jgi:hypothetical protein
MPAEPTRPSERTRRVGTGLILALAAASLLVFGLDFVVERHPYFEVERWPGFYGLAGAASCLAAIIVALLLRRIVLRPEDYYDR